MTTPGVAPAGAVPLVVRTSGPVSLDAGWRVAAADGTVHIGPPRVPMAVQLVDALAALPAPPWEAVLGGDAAAASCDSAAYRRLVGLIEDAHARGVPRDGAARAGTPAYPGAEPLASAVRAFYERAEDESEDLLLLTDVCHADLLAGVWASYAEHWGDAGAAEGEPSAAAIAAAATGATRTAGGAQLALAF